jgi:heme oxygenase
MGDFEWVERVFLSRFPIDQLSLRLAEVTTPAEYRAALLHIHGFIAPIERMLERARIDEFVDLQKRRKAHLLLNDLAAMGMSSNELPVCETVPDLVDPTSALGWMFFVERSTLFHDAAFHRLAHVIPKTMRNASSYLKCYVGRAGANWRAFGARIYHVAGTSAERELVLKAAANAMACHEGWLEQTKPLPALPPRGCGQEA